MRVLGIHGSPRANGNSALLLNRLLQGAQSAGANPERLRVSDLSIAGCRACDACEKTGWCVVDDGMQSVHQALERADHIVLASPVYFAAFPGPLKNLIDRCQVLWWRREKRRQAGQPAQRPHRRGVLLATAAHDLPNNFKGLETCARAFFRSIDAPYTDGLYISGVEHAGAVLEKPDALQQAHDLGRRLVESGSRTG